MAAGDLKSVLLRNRATSMLFWGLHHDLKPPSSNPNLTLALQVYRSGRAHGFWAPSTPKQEPTKTESQRAFISINYSFQSYSSNTGIPSQLKFKQNMRCIFTNDVCWRIRDRLHDTPTMSPKTKTKTKTLIRNFCWYIAYTYIASYRHHSIVMQVYLANAGLEIMVTTHPVYYLNLP